MRTCFSKLSGALPECFVLSRDTSGKPYLVDPPATLTALSFNVSHAGDYATFAGSTSAKVGVDVMKVELRRNTTVEQFFGHMKRQFTDFEWQRIRSPGSDRGKLFNFYRYWCLKESYVKAIGTGLKFGLLRIEFDIGRIEDDICRTTTVAIDGAIDSDWRFEEAYLDNHFITIAVQGEVSPGEDVEDNVKVVKFDDLIVNKDLLDDEKYFVSFDEKKECP